LSFVPGQIGEWSSYVMMASMGAQSLVGVMDIFKGGKIATMFTGLGTAGAGAAAGIGAMILPALGVVAALGVVGYGLWKIKDDYDKHQAALNQFSEAVKTSSTTLTGFAAKFGYTELVSGISTQTTATDKGGRERAVTAKSAVQDQLKEGVDPAFKTKIEALRKSTEQEAEQALKSTFFALISSGAPQDVAKSIVEQIAIETNKQDVFKGMADDFKVEFDKNGKLKKSAELIKKTLAPNLKEAAKNTLALAAAQAKMDKLDAARAYNDWSPKTKAELEAQKNLDILKDKQISLGKVTKETTTEVSDSLSKMYAGGMISQTEYSDGFLTMRQSMTDAFGGDEKGLTDALTGSIQALSPALKDVNLSAMDSNAQFAILKALMTGVAPGDITKILNDTGNTADVAAVKIANLTNQILNNQAAGGINTGGVDAQIGTVKTQLASATKNLKSLQGQKPKSSGGGGGGGGAPKKSKYDKKSDVIARANARLDLAEVKIDKTEDKKIQNALTKRFGSMTFEIAGMKITMKNAADVEYAMQQIDETIEDINRNQIDPLNEKLDKLHDKQDAINRQTDLYQQEIDKINESYDEMIKPVEKVNTALQAQSDALEAQRDEALNGVEIQIAALENQISVTEYAAQQATDLIDAQQAKNSATKDLIDQQVSAIDDQIAALQEVADINQIIADQQKNQLDLAGALSSGDAGAAASAMLGAQSSSASNNSSLQTKGLESSKGGLESQSKALDEQNSLLDKRKEAIQKGVDALNKQLDALSQQKTLIENNYKIELQAISDVIARNSEYIRQLEVQRDLQTSNWQKQIDKYAPALRDIDNEIYGIEQKIKTIQDEKIKPLEKQKALLEDILGDVKDQIAREKAVIDQKRKQLDYASKINNAMKTLHDKNKTAAGSAGSVGTAMGNWAKKIKAAQDEIDRLNKLLKKLLTEKTLSVKVKYINGKEVYFYRDGSMSIGKGGPHFKAARGGIASLKGLAGGGILPGFRGVTHGDNVPAMLRSGEGITVSEALKTNKFETKRLMALNKAALSGNMAGFYQDFAMPTYTTPKVASVSPVHTDNSSTVYNEYRLEVNVPNSNASADEIANTVMLKIKDFQRGQVRSGS